MKDLTKRLLAPGRDSPEIADQGHHPWQANLSKYKQWNEDIFIEHFFNPLTNEARNVLSESGQTVQREWQKDDLNINQNQLFLTDSLNRLITDDNKE